MAKTNLNLGVDTKQVQQLVLNSSIDLGQLTVDPITAEQQARYRTEGLTYLSNNTSIIPRDEAGNILLKENSTTNPLLIIDPVTEKITTKSALRVLDTRFQYYKFPVEIIPSNDIEDLVIDLDFESDSISERYTIPTTIDDQGQPITLQRVGTGNLTTWFTNNNAKQQGFTRIPFSGGTQSEIGSFQLTPDVLETLRSRNKTLRFSIQLGFQSVYPNIAYDTNGNQVSTAVITGTKVEYVVRLSRAVPEGFTQSGALYELTTESNGKYQSNEFPLMQLEVLLDINESQPYDKYYIEAQTKIGLGLLNTEISWWKIDVVDIPKTTSLTGEIGAGIYSFGGNSKLSEIINSTVVELYERSGDGTYTSLIPVPVLDNAAVTASNPTGNVSPIIDETYQPYGEKGIDGETRPYYDVDGNQIATFVWNSDAQRWDQEE